ncbi:MAG TPA: hypothetical protein VJN96_26570 [Vicinamibacterales bacterium]|nr:hypothetical protein [Vicinamibacterales bacterium]
MQTGRIVAPLTLAAIIAAACGGTNSPAGPTPAVLPVQQVPALTAPTPVSPAAGSTQPFLVKLVVVNVPPTATARPTQYRFEVATNSSFEPVFTTGLISEGIGQTSFIVDLALPTGVTIYWRAQAADSTVTGPYCPTQSFMTTAGAATLFAPILLSPSDGDIVGLRPNLRVKSGGYAGLLDRSAYVYEVATDPSFRHRIVRYTSDEYNTNGMTPSTDLEPGTTYYWRARQFDSTPASLNHSYGDFGPAQRFVTSGSGS